QCLDVMLRIGADHALDLAPCIVGGMALDKYDLQRLRELRDAADGGFDIAALVARRNDDARRARRRVEPPQRAADRVVPQAQRVEQGQRRDKTIDEAAQSEKTKRR